MFHRLGASLAPRGKMSKLDYVLQRTLGPGIHRSASAQDTHNNRSNRKTTREGEEGASKRSRDDEVKMQRLRKQQRENWTRAILKEPNSTLPGKSHAADQQTSEQQQQQLERPRRESNSSSSWLDPMLMQELKVCAQVGDWERCLEVFEKRLSATKIKPSKLLIKSKEEESLVDATTGMEIYNAFNNAKSGDSSASSHREEEIASSDCRGEKTEVTEEEEGEMEGGGRGGAAGWNDDVSAEEAEYRAVHSCVEILLQAMPSTKQGLDRPPSSTRDDDLVKIIIECIVNHPVVSLPQRRLHLRLSKEEVSLPGDLAAAEEGDSSVSQSSGSEGGVSRGGGHSNSVTTIRRGGPPLRHHFPFYEQFHVMQQDQYLSICRTLHRLDRSDLAIDLYKSQYLSSPSSTLPQAADHQGEKECGSDTPEGSDPDHRHPTIIPRTVPRKASIAALMLCEKMKRWDVALELIVGREALKKAGRDGALLEKGRRASVWPNEDEKTGSSASTEVPGTNSAPKHFLACGTETIAEVLSLLERHRRFTERHELMKLVSPRDRKSIDDAYSKLITDWGAQTGSKYISKYD